MCMQPGDRTKIGLVSNKYNGYIQLGASDTQTGNSMNLG